MERLFIRVLQMSLAGAVVILGVLLLRLLMRRAPGRFRYLLWIVPAFRLCVPLSLPSPVSLFRLFRGGPLGEGDYTPAGLTLPLENAVQTAGAGQGTRAAGTAAATAAEVSAVPWLRLLAWVWLVVAAALLLYSFISALLLRQRLATAVRLEGRVYQADRINSPFILGLYRPRIYIPWGMERADLEYSLTHEHCHIRRGDPWWRLLGWLILCLHWYNPLCWLGYFFMGRDMEQSCDEAVLEHLGDVRRAYSESLLRIAGKSRLSSPAPLAFGEAGVGSRVRNVLKWRKARGWVTVTAMLLCVLFTVAWVTDPASSPSLTLNPDGTVGALWWGMSPEEAMAADRQLIDATDSNPAWVCLERRGVNILGHTGDVTLNFAKYSLEGDLHMDKEGTPFLKTIHIRYPGNISLTENLTGLFGEQEKHPLNFNHDPEIVDGVYRPYFDPRELPEERWYWHSDETILDLMPLEQLRISYPDRMKQLTSSRGGTEDDWLQRAWCDTFAYDVHVTTEEAEDGTYTWVQITGDALAFQRYLSEEWAKMTEGGN